MCELLAMSSLRPTRLTFSFETLAAHGAANGRSRDGWGVAFYQDRDVALIREPRAAGDSPLVRFLETQGPDTTLGISHVRRATRGPTSLANIQPFARELAGRMHVFAHNGDLPGIEASMTLAYDRYRPLGSTDSGNAYQENLAARSHDRRLANLEHLAGRQSDAGRCGRDRAGVSDPSRRGRGHNPKRQKSNVRAQAFIDFLASSTGAAILAKLGWMTTAATSP